MKPPFILFLLVLVFVCGSAAAQTRAINFDIRSDATESSNGGGVSRNRFVRSSDNRSNTSSAEAIEKQVFSMINAERTKNGLIELEWSERLAELARLHSQDMAQQKFFSHRGSDGSMIDDRADRIGLGLWRSIGENIAYMRGYDDPAAVAIEKWLESAAHRKNLLGPNWKESAVGVAVTSDGTYYMTEVFLVRK